MQKKLKILLIRRGALGDILMTTPMLRQLKQQQPSSQIDYCLGSGFRFALINNPYLDNIIPLEEKTFQLKGVLKFLKFAWSIRKKYDYVFVLGKSWQFNLLCKVIGVRQIGFVRDKLSRWLLDASVPYNDLNRYQVNYYLDLLNASDLGIVNYHDGCLDLFETQEDIFFVEQLLKKQALDKFIVITNSGGNNSFENNAIRMLPDDKIVSLLEMLVKQDYRIVLLGGSQDIENYTRYIMKIGKCDRKKIYNFAGKLTVAQSKCLLGHAQVFVTTDCGAMHIGISLATYGKMVCLFGVTNPNHILPRDKAILVLDSGVNVRGDSYQLSGKTDNKSFTNEDYFRDLNILGLVVAIGKLYA